MEEDDLAYIKSIPHFSSALALLNSSVHVSLSPDEALSSSQKVLSRAVDEFTFCGLLDSSPDNHDRARLNSLSLPHSGDWVNTIPNLALGLHIKDTEYIADILEDLALGCGQQSERIARHDSLRDVLFQAARQAGLAPVREERNLLAAQEDRVEQRPGDIVVKCWKDGKDSAWDVTVISPLQFSSNIVLMAATTPGYAFTLRFNQNNLCARLKASASPPSQLRHWAPGTPRLPRSSPGCRGVQKATKKNCRRGFFAHLIFCLTNVLAI